jgi:putative alpha-1,2-mannosidase
MIGSPTFPRATIHLENGHNFTLIAHGAGPQNRYIQSAKLNGRNYHKCWISHEDIVEGGTLEVVMGAEPCLEWGRE